MSSNVSYTSCYFNTLYNSLRCGFTFSLTLFIGTSWENLSPSFDSNKGVIESLKLLAEHLSPTKKNADENEQNTQALFFLKTYNLGSTGNDFLISSLFLDYW